MSELLGEAGVSALLDLLGGPAVLIPIPHGTKKPADPGWQSFGDEEMSNPDYIARFNNGGNIGVVLGLPSDGLCSIDIDEDELVEEFLKHNPALRTTLRTRRLFGCNFWIRVTGPYPSLKPFHHARLKNEKNKPRQVGEWRSTGGQTVIEGQAEGRAYEKIVTAKPITIPFYDIVWPEWICDPPTLDPDDDKSSQPSGNGCCLDKSKLENIVDRANGAFNCACPACREAGEDKSGNHLYILPDGRYGCCKYPKDKQHTKEIYRLAGIPKPISQDRNEYWPQGDYDTDGNPLPSLQLPPIVEACDFMSVEIPPLQLLVEGILHQGTKLVLGGGSKAYKTWLLSDLAISICAGMPWLGFNCVKGRVLYINLEIHDQFFQERLKALAKSKGVQFTPKSLDLWNLRGHAAPYHTLIPLMIERIKSECYSAVILDPIYKLYGKTDENSAGEVAQLLNTVETICTKTQSATAFGAHYSKGNQASKESIDRISGSGVFARDPDSILPFTKHKEEGCFTVDPILRNLPPVDSFCVRWQYPLMLTDSTLDPADLKQVGGRPKNNSYNDIFDLLPDSGLLVSEWQSKASENLGISRATFFRLKNELVSKRSILLSKIDNKWKPLINQQDAKS